MMQTILTRMATYILPALKWVWKALWYPAALPVVVVIALAGLSAYFGMKYNRVVREAVTYQDSIVRAQDTELWRLRSDTLEANFEIRELYKRLNARDKEEVIYFNRLHRANDADLQRDLDSVFDRHLAAPRGFPGRATAPAEFNLISGWGETSPVRSLSGR